MRPIAPDLYPEGGGQVCRTRLSSASPMGSGFAFAATASLRATWISGYAVHRRCQRPAKKGRSQFKCSVAHEVSFTAPDGKCVAAWRVSPVLEPTSNGRGVVLLSDVLGYKNEDTRDFARALAEFGLSVIIPDIFRGCPWTEGPTEAYEGWRASHDPQIAIGDAALAAVELKRMGLSVGLLGFCYGGGLLMNEIARGSQGIINPAAAAVFYPTRFDAEAAGRLAECPLMAVFADKDKIVPKTVVEELKRGLEKNTVMEDCDLLVYEGAGHGFAHHPKTPQDMDDSEILKFQTTEWFVKHLPESSTNGSDVDAESGNR